MATKHGDLFQTYAKIYYAAIGTALPAITQDFDTAWPSPWVYAGETQSETTIIFEVPTTELTTEQSGIAAEIPSGAEVTTIETTLAEVNAKTIMLTFGGTKTLVESPAPHTKIEGGGTTAFDRYTWGIQGVYPLSDGGERPMFFQAYIGRANVGGELTFGRETQGAIPLKIRAFPDPAKAKGVNTWKFQYLDDVA